MTDQPDDDFDETPFQDYPKFPAMVGYFGHQPSEAPSPEEQAFRHGQGPLAVIPDFTVANNLATIANELHVANLIAWQQLTGEKYRAETRKALGLTATEESR